MAENEPTWAIISRTLYENKLAGRTFTDYGYTGLSRQIAIAEETDLEFAKVARTIPRMIEQGLITEVNPNIPKKGYNLTKKGFDVAHTRDLRRQEQRREQKRDKRQHEVNRAIGFLTVGLLLTGFLQAVITAQIGKEEQLLFVNITLGLGFLIVAAITGLLWNSGMLASWDSDDSDEDRTENGDEDDDENRTDEAPEDEDEDLDELG